MLTVLTIIAVLIASMLVTYVAATVEHENARLQEARSKARSTRHF